MTETEFIWLNGVFVPWGKAQVHVLTHTLHYGGGTFEGIRFYKTLLGPAIFRLDDHLDRLFYSANVLQMESSYTAQQLKAATIELVRRNKVEEGYIRPLIYFGYGKMGLNPKGAPVEAAIACWPWGPYLPETVDVKTSSFIRIHPASSVTDAKICGHYVNSILAVQELQGTKYHEALLLDFEGNIAEGPGENLFLIKNGKLFTPKLGAILSGITRKTVLELARGLGISVHETTLTLKDAYDADEAFYTGTAAEVSPIRSIDDHTIGSGDIGPTTKRLRDLYSMVVHGEETAFHHLLTFTNA